MSVAETIMDRLVNRLRSIDGGAYSGTLFGAPYSGTYAFDLSDADSVVRGMDGPEVVPPYVNVGMRLVPGAAGTNLCKTMWILTAEVLGVVSVEGYLSDEQRTKTLALANDIMVAVMADRDAQTAGSLRALGVESITPSVDEVYSDTEGLVVAGCVVTFQMQYQTSGIGL